MSCRMDCTESCMSCHMDCTESCRDYCTDCCSPDSSNGCLGCSSILIDSYCTDDTDRCSGCCSSDSSLSNRLNSSAYKGRIAQRLDCYLLQLSLRQERQLTLVLWHHVSSKFRFSPLRHYTLVGTVSATTACSCI
jgi:hypothetical protein